MPISKTTNPSLNLALKVNMLLICILKDLSVVMLLYLQIVLMRGKDLQKTKISLFVLDKSI